MSESGKWKKKGLSNQEKWPTAIKKRHFNYLRANKAPFLCSIIQQSRNNTAIFLRHLSRAAVERTPFTALMSHRFGSCPGYRLITHSVFPQPPLRIRPGTRAEGMEGFSGGMERKHEPGKAKISEGNCRARNIEECVVLWLCRHDEWKWVMFV